MENVTYRYVGRAEYGAVWEMQKRMFNELLEAKKAGIGAGQTLLMVEHPHVYTLGKSGHESNMLVSDEFLRLIGASYFHTDRGGDITYHGYGQLVGYPILDLERLGLSLKEYVWTVEECVIRTVAEYGIEAGRLDGATGRLDRGRHAARAQDLRYRGQGFALCDDARVRAERDDRSVLFLVHQSLRLCRQGGYLDRERDGSPAVVGRGGVSLRRAFRRACRLRVSY